MLPCARLLGLLAVLLAAGAILGASARGAPNPPWMAVLPEIAGKKGDRPVAVPHCRRARPRCIRVEIRRTSGLRERLGCDRRAVFATSSLVLAETLRQTVRSQPGLFRFPKYLFRQQALSAEVYFDTLRAWDRGKPVAPAWQIAFQTARRADVNAIQDMLLGINAHVQSDLPFVIAALGVRGRGGKSRKHGNRALNAVMDRTFAPTARTLAAEYDPLVSDPNWSPVEGVSGSQLVRSWRKTAWRNAKRLEKAKGARERRAVAKRIAANAAEWAETIAAPQEPGHHELRDAYCADGIFGFEPLEESTDPENSADELIFWNGCEQVGELTDAELDRFAAIGVDAFVCSVHRLSGLGGSQDFTGDPNADLSGPNYELQRSLRDSRIVERAADRGIRLHLGFWFANSANTATPLLEWFDDAGWSDLVLPRIRELAAAAHQLGFAGVAIDQELYGDNGATWNWDYPGNTHTEAEVRAKARERGEQVMTAILEGFPDADLPIYHVHMPGMWGELVVEEVRDKPNAYAKALDVDFLGGMLSVEGYGSVRILNSMLQKTPHITDNWDAAMQYESNQVMSLLSREVDNWDHASSRLHWMPFSWIDGGPSSGTFDDPRPVAYVERQLQAMRKWGMGGAFANFDYGGLNTDDYTPYAEVVEAASSPAQVDGEDPTLELTSTGPLAIEGTAHDNLGIRAVRWRDNRRGSGVAEMTWEVLSGNPDSGYEWQMRWSIPATEISSAATEVRVAAEDFKGKLSAPVTLAGP